MRLKGRRIMVTGAAGGIGAAIAELFAREGAALALVDCDAEGMQSIADRVGAAAYPCDVTDLAAVERSVDRAVRGMGGIDGLVNAAGILSVKPFAELDPETWNRLLAVNLSGPYHMIRAALPALRQADAAAIVNIASVSGLMPMEGTSGYSTSKAGLIMLSKSLALELGPKIRVNTICPGFIVTNMTLPLTQDPEHARRAAERVAAKRLGAPEEIARGALFLIDDDSGFITGTEVVIDGGFSWR